MLQKWIWTTLEAITAKTASEGKNCGIILVVLCGLQADAGGTASLAKLLITRLALISVSEQN